MLLFINIIVISLAVFHITPLLHPVFEFPLLSLLSYDISLGGPVSSPLSDLTIVK